MPCATKAPPKKRRKKPPVEYPCCYDKLPPEVQKKAIRSWLNEHYWPDQDDVHFLTEDLEGVLSYEFGIDVEQREYKFANGKTGHEPELYWTTYGYPRTEFNANLDIDKVIAHGVPGCEYYSPLADKLRQTLQAVEMLNAVAGCEYEPEWSFCMTTKERRAEVSYNYCGTTTEQEAVYDLLANEIDEILEGIYTAACDRLEYCIDADIDYRNSDEAVAETLLDNDHILFDEEGDMA